MNIYKQLNEITLYIENHIEEKIDYDELSKIMGVNNYTMQRIFSCLAGIPLAEYIRKRRLSIAASDLIKDKSKIIDLAIKYNYESPTSFSRAFTSFHNIKPSEVDENSKLHEFPRLIFNEDIVVKKDIEYSIESLPELKLYGVGIKTDCENIHIDAPRFFKETESKYKDKYGLVKYGLVSYKDTERLECDYYYCLYDKIIPDFKLITIPASRWIKFRINSQEAIDIQNVTNKFYEEFLPSCQYKLKDIPELEYYHDDITDFYVPID